MKRKGDIIEITEDNEVFVFGSNLSGIHGGGAAKYAIDNYGARMHGYYGFMGRSFAIPTKDENINTLPLDRIKLYVDAFLSDAEKYPDKLFIVTPIGCGLAGYNPSDIAPMFSNIPSNVILPEEFKDADK